MTPDRVPATGGHPQAAGGTLRMSMHQAINFTQEIFEQFLSPKQLVVEEGRRAE